MKRFFSTNWVLALVVGAGVAVIALVALMLSHRLTLSVCGTEGCKAALEWLGFGVTSLLFVGGLYQYWKSQRWKRTEWIANETESFFADKKVMNALHMLDWNRRRLPLLLEAPETGQNWFDFEASMLPAAWYSRRTIPKDSEGKERGFTEEELAIRDCFDRLFDRLERFEIFLMQGLVSESDLRPYLEYWARLIGDKDFGRKPPSSIVQLWNYIDDYGFYRVQDLLRRFDYDIVPERDHSRGETWNSEQ